VYRLTYDGSVADEHGFVAMGGGAEQIEAGLKERWREGMHLSEALSLAVDLLGADPAGGPRRDLPPEALEVAVLDRHRPRRTFRRITGHLLERLLSADDPTSDAPDLDEGDGSVRDAATNPQTQRPTQEGPPA
jgi:proteasome alpha subunit